MHVPYLYIVWKLVLDHVNSFGGFASSLAEDSCSMKWKNPIQCICRKKTKDFAHRQRIEDNSKAKIHFNKIANYPLHVTSS